MDKKQSIDHWVSMHKNNEYFNTHKCYEDPLQKNNVNLVYKLLRLKDTDTVLDLGGGYGRLAVHLAKYVRRWVVVDLAVDPLEYGQLLMNQHNIKNVEFVKYNGHFISGKYNFNVGICLNVMQHVPVSIQKLLLYQLRCLCDKRIVVQYLIRDDRKDKNLVDKIGEQNCGLSYLDIVKRHIYNTYKPVMFYKNQVSKRKWVWVTEFDRFDLSS